MYNEQSEYTRHAVLINNDILQCCVSTLKKFKQNTNSSVDMMELCRVVYK